MILADFWRVDAQHEHDGALTMLFIAPFLSAKEEAERLQACGWKVDLYLEVNNTPLENEVVDLLAARPWPVAPLDKLIAAAQRIAGALAKTRDELAAIQRRQHAMHED